MELFDIENSIEINSIFQRSTRLDSKLSEDYIKNYIFHDTSRSILNRIADSYLKSNQAAFTLTGPYGSGKSSLALFLNALVHDNVKIQKAALNKANPGKRDSYNKIFSSKQKWFSIKIVGGKENTNELMAETIDYVIKENWISKNIPSSLKLKTKTTTSSIVKKLNDLVKELAKKNYGLLIICDEMGRLLEYSSNTGGDLNLFQEIAENFANNKLEKQGENVFIGILHQPFEEYASSLGRSVQEEWQKIQGRFLDIPFSIGSEESIFLISNAIRKTKKLSDNAEKKIFRITKSILRTLDRDKATSSKTLEQSLIKCFPLNPLVSLLLGPISRNKFGQNERSIFTFLNSGEPSGLLNYLKNHDIQKGHLYNLDHLYDYLQLNLEPSILVSNIGSLWAEASEAIRRSETTDNKQVIKLAKAIALIDLFGKNLSINASKEVLYDALPNTKNEIDSYLETLEEKKIIIYRKFKKAYALYSGSDINLDEIVQQNKTQIQTDYPIILSQIPELPPVIAKRHLHQFGALRIFKKHCVFLKNVKSTVDEIIRLSEAAISTGPIVLVFKDKEDTKAQFEEKFKELCSISFEQPTIIGYSNQSERTLDYALELAALGRAKASVSSIESDLVARKELYARMSAAQNLLFEELNLAFDNATWQYKKQKFEDENLSSITSKISNLIYSKSPVIINELVNREKTSALTTFSIINLTNSILTKAGEPELGMEGLPAERAIYLSVIKNNNLYGKKNGQYQFLNPSKSVKGIYDIYEFIRNYLVKADKPVQLSEIYHELKKPPFGVKSSLLPIFMSCFFKANEEHFALYENYDHRGETFITEFSHQLVDRIIQIPEDIKIMHVKIEGAKVDILHAFKDYAEKEFNQKIKDPTPLNILKPFVVKTHKMSGWSRRTRRFSDKRVIMLRDELLKSRNPFQLLYNKLPEICLSKPVSAQGITGQDIDSFISEFKNLWSELNNAHEILINKFKETIIKVFQSDPNIFDIDFDTIKQRAAIVGEQDPFSAKLSKSNNDSEWIEQIAAYSISKPLEEWIDSDFDQAQLKTEEMVRHFIMTDRLITLKSKHKDSKIIDLAIYDGDDQQRASKFYFQNFKGDKINEAVEEINQLLSQKSLSESEKGEIALKVLQSLMSKKSDKKNSNKKEPA